MAVETTPSAIPPTRHPIVEKASAPQKRNVTLRRVCRDSLMEYMSMIVEPVMNTYSRTTMAAVRIGAGPIPYRATAARVGT